MSRSDESSAPLTLLVRLAAPNPEPPVPKLPTGVETPVELVMVLVELMVFKLGLVEMLAEEEPA